MEYSHGVIYKPEDLENSVYSIEEATKSGAKFVRVYWVDLANIRRCRVLPIKYFNQVLRSRRPGINVAKGSFGLIFLDVAEGFTAIGEYLYALDMSTLRPLPFAPGHLGVLGYFEEKTPILGPQNELIMTVPLCPRTLLKRVVNEAQEICQTKFLVGFESEFILLSSLDPVTPSSHHQWNASNGILAGSKEFHFLEEVGTAMEESGLSLQVLLAEGAPGQYEVVSGPLSPLEAADQVVLVRELVANVASKHGFHVTFAPRPFMDSLGSAAHIHISVHRDDGSEKPRDHLSSSETSFLAGVLEHISAITAITLPIPASYDRMADQLMSGGTYIHYGTENREAPVRITNATSPHSRNFEMRFVDGTANPYLALAAIIGAGLVGLKTGKEPTMKDCEGPKCAWQMDDTEREALGITKKMPLTIEQARANLQHDEVLKEVLGSGFVENFLAVTKTLGTALSREGETEEQGRRRLVELY